MTIGETTGRTGLLTDDTCPGNARRGASRRGGARPATALLTATVLAVPAASALTSGPAWATGSTPAASTSGTATPTTPAPAAVPTPAVPTRLPAAIEATAGYQPQTSCDPVSRTGTRALGQLLVRTYPGTSFGGIRPCGADGGTSPSEHYEGRAVDWMVDSRVPAQNAEADAAIAWLLATDAAGNKYAMARRLGVMYIIWNKRIFGLYRPADGWRPYSCSGVTACHQDHVHISLTWNGATGRTSFWTRQVSPTDYGPCRPADLNWAPRYSGVNLTPCPPHATVAAPAGATAAAAKLMQYSGAEVTAGQTGPVVAAVQSALGVPATGTFGSAAAAALTAYQTAHHVPATGVMDAATWRVLVHPSATPAPRPSTKAPAATTKAAPSATASARAEAVSPLRKYRSAVLRRGSRGAAVTALQRAIHVRATGYFGSTTYAAVVRLQRAKHLRVTGVVTVSTWQALGG